MHSAGDTNLLPGRMPAARANSRSYRWRSVAAGSQFGVTGQRLDLSRDAGVLNDVVLAVALAPTDR